MSELTNCNTHHGFHGQLLISVSVAALLLSISGNNTKAESTFLANSDRPPLWIYLGGQLEQVNGGLAPEIFGFETAPNSLALGTGLDALQKPPGSDFGLNGGISFEPGNTNWIFSASIRYGRSQRAGHFHKSFVPTINPTTPFPLDAHARSTENHTIMDFQAGKDVGLGTAMQSTISAGLRFAQFNSSGQDFVTSSPKREFLREFRYKGAENIDRGTSALGPSIAWNGCTALLGTLNEGLALDWGANAALLFGRQKVRGHIHTHYAGYPNVTLYRTENINIDIDRGKNRLIPNVGGTIGFSYHLPAAELSIGYRADMFFNAVDGGVQTEKIYNRGFYGPFATISVGLGG